MPDGDGPAAGDEFPMSRGAIWALCLLLTPICGAVPFYAWRKSNPAAARYANNASLVSFLLWAAIWIAVKFAT